MCQAHPAPRCMNDAYRDKGRAKESFDFAQQDFEAAERALADVLEDQRTFNALPHVDGDDALREVTQQQMDRDVIECRATVRQSAIVLEEKKRILAKHDHQFDVAVTTSYRASKQALQRDATAEKPLSANDRAKHQEIVARGEQLKADEAKWTALRRERFVRAELAKYEQARKKYGEVSTTTAFPNPRLLVDALSILPMLPHNKTGGGRDLTAVEKELLAATKAGVDQYEVEDYLPAEDVKVTRAVEKNGARKKGVTARIRGEREASTVVKEAETPRPVLTSDVHRPARKFSGRELPPLPSLKGNTSAAPRTPKPELARASTPTPPTAFPSKDAVVTTARPVQGDESVRPAAAVPDPVLSPRPQTLRDRTPSEPESKSRPSLVKRILGGRG